MTANGGGSVIERDLTDVVERGIVTASSARGLVGRPVEVFVADDHPVYRNGLRDVIGRCPELLLVGSAEDGREAVRDIRLLRPDVAVLDVRMPHLDGPEVLAALRREGLGISVLFLSGFDEPKVVYDALSGGASGYLSKCASVAEICEAILAVSRGEVALASELQAGFLAEVRAHREAGRPLSQREHDVVRMTADGLTAVQIGKQLHLSPATVRTYLQRVYEKLGVADRAAMVAQAMREGLIR